MASFTRIDTPNLGSGGGGGKVNPPSMLTLHAFCICIVYSHKSKGVYPYEVFSVGSKKGFPHHFSFLQEIYSDFLLRTLQS